MLRRHWAMTLAAAAAAAFIAGDRFEFAPGRVLQLAFAGAIWPGCSPSRCGTPHGHNSIATASAAC